MNYSSEELGRQAGILMRTHALLYYAVSRILTEEEKFQGGRAVRHWIRIQANWRGEEMKKAHTALGMPIDVEHIQRFWDNALSDFWYRKEGKYTTYDVAMQVPSCAYADVWQERDWWMWGHVYCDELHQHILETYNPDGVVVIPECLMKGDEQCDFRWIMPPFAQLKFDDIKPDYEGQDHRKDYLAQTPEEAQKKNIRRGVRLLGMELYMLKRTLTEFFPEKVEERYEEILRLLAKERAADLKRFYEKSGEDWKKFFEKSFDLPFTAFDADYEEDDDRLLIRFCDNPLEEGLNYFGAGEEAELFMRQQCIWMNEEKEMPVELRFEKQEDNKGELIIEVV
ncbi:L-2-amino-thiazoline-4-carboxylic acid hydrolase [Faecalicatena contorta]|uniref:L-2-amino-thiazoline-4-carboxylic acid hydrolase n=1 Tax=Faecalicatena contorta TaxID=39482 RepID=UPI001960E93E|nr:L-2-amino-thiazoline-4-carboxylic acid hydrolase [Faecalicatena contorta]MBM6686092.1 L-2-amino-thiazoline-4-carboxylic acid hydrolase [Faecalicatena contorta]MBM6710641.1 L-2-amino-thiazoline-4-carboxylic acid hydrolase [Faecalicatena contorta]